MPATAVIAAVLFGGTCETSWSASISAARDGPFGIYMGEPLADLRPVVLDDPSKPDNGIYRVLHPARANADLPIVAVVAYPSTGVCSIVASSDLIEDDPSGTKVRAIVDRLAEPLKAKYGPYEKVDDCNDSDQGCDQTWTFDQKQGSATYAYKWPNSAALHALGIKRMALMARAESPASTRVTIGYDSDDKACDAAAAAAESSGL